MRLPALPLRLALSAFCLLFPLHLFAVISYPPPTFATTGSGPFAIATADFNGDCSPDFATANQFDSTVTVRFGNGSGGFPTAATYSGFQEPQSIVTADFNGDGAPDLAVGNHLGFSPDPVASVVSILLNDGSGAFAPLPVAQSPATGGIASRMATADLDEDGNADLLVSDNQNTFGVRFYAGDGTGHFAAPVLLPTGTHPAGAIAVMDLNGDDDLDLAVTTGDALGIFLGNGDGTFAAPAFLLYPDPIEGADGAVHVAAADIDHDGDSDLATVAGNVQGGATVFRNNGDATFTRTRFKMPIQPANPVFVALADLDGDGNLDIVSANQYGCTPEGSNLSARPGNGDGTFGASNPISVGYGPTCLDSHWQPNAIAALDLNCDGAADMIVPNMSTSFVSVLLTAGAPDTSAPVITAPASISVSADAGSCSATVSNAQLGIATATDNCSSCVTITRVPAGNVFAPGTTVVTWTATDGSGNSASDTQTVTVTASLPVLSGGTASPAVLWPPNHKLVPVLVSYSITGGCGSATCAITSVTSNEPVNGLGDGDAAPDWQVVDATHVRLRAERAGNGTGRIYTITITCSDADGNSVTKTVPVTVPVAQH